MIKVLHRATMVPTAIMKPRVLHPKIPFTRTVVMAVVRLPNFLLHHLQPALIRVLELLKVRLKLKTKHKSLAKYRETFVPA